MFDYEKFIYHVGSLYVELLAANGTRNGELTIVVKPQNGETRTLYVHIDGTSFQLYDEPGAVLFDFDVEAE